MENEPVKQDEKWLLQNRMLKTEVMDLHDVRDNDIEGCLWEWTTEVESREDGCQETKYKLLDESKNKWRRMNRIWRITTFQVLMKLRA